MISKKSGILLFAYTIITALWIFGTDWLISPMVSESETTHLVLPLKDWIFIVVSGGFLFYWAGNKQDVKQELAKSEQRYRQLFENSLDGIMLTNPNGDILRVNPAGCRILGMEEEEIIALGREGVVHKDNKLQKAVQQREETGGFSGELTFIHKTGKHIPVALTTSIYHAEAAGNQRTSLIFRDISDRKVREQLLQQQVRLRKAIMSVGTVALEAETLKELYELVVDKIAFLSDAQSVKLINITELSGPQVMASSRTDAVSLDRQMCKGLPNTADPHIIPPDRLRPITDQLPGISFSIGVTIPGKSKPHGCLTFHYKNERELNSKDHLFLKAIAHILGITIARQEAEQDLRQSLQEKRTLLAEIHHRIKNNLAVISGMLDLQAADIEDENIKFVLRDSQWRIHTIATIHEKLYQSETLSEIASEQFIEELLDAIHNTYHAKDSQKISYKTTIDNIALDMDQAVPIGLMLNELVSNAYKHAFENKDRGTISVEFTTQDSGCRLRVADNGRGLSEDFSIQQSNSLGMKLIESLTMQLDGDLKYRNMDNGCEFVITIKL